MAMLLHECAYHSHVHSNSQIHSHSQTHSHIIHSIDSIHIFHIPRYPYQQELVATRAADSGAQLTLDSLARTARKTMKR